MSTRIFVQSPRTAISRTAIVVNREHIPKRFRRGPRRGPGEAGPVAQAHAHPLPHHIPDEQIWKLEGMVREGSGHDGPF